MRKIISNMCQTVPAQQMKCVVLTVFFHAHWVYCVCRSRVCFCVQIWLWVLNHLWSSTPAQVFISGIWEISLHREQKAAALWPCVGWYLSQHSGAAETKSYLAMEALMLKLHWETQMLLSTSVSHIPLSCTLIFSLQFAFNLIQLFQVLFLVK